ncbi:hypothetical protein [Clostridium sp. 'White wine YQ']|uniref:hypothetical protein n=1 Tax=Clostridium sp. 'White wine YQ' TaxID=3027474 RepID=UPI00236719DA|nr:hypothetical protein [Clostridium sp. 'White wine YQ']MDD7793958.1 hypothetical protein [Clostridium sp. 'White wine YQ']
MKIKKITYPLVLAVLSLNLYSCDNNVKSDKNKSSFKDYSKVVQGSVNYYNNGKMQIILDLDKNIKFSDNEEGALINYNKKENRYLREKNVDNSKNLILGIENKENTIDSWKDIKDVKLSPSGDKVFYSKEIKENNVALGIYDSSNKKFAELKTNTLISGNNYVWLDNYSIIYYGVKDESKLNGIFLYNTKTNNEKLLLDIKKGAIEYIEVEGNKIIYLTSDFDGNKSLNSFDIDNSKVKVLTTEVQNINDIIVLENKMFILGKRKDGLSSLYLLSDGKLKKLVYDFPKNIDLEKGIEKDLEGNILFIGYDDSSSKEDVYELVSVDGTVKIKSKKTGQYSFIETN